MKKFCLYFLITLILAGVLFAQVSPQAEPSPSSVPAQESIAVPEGNGKPVLLDGLFARGEWDDALGVSIHDRIKLFLKVNSGHLFLGLKYEEAVGVVTDIWMTSDDKIVFQMHSSGQLGEGVLSLPVADGKTETIMGYTKDWDANEIKSDSKKKAEWQAAGRPKEGYRQTLFPSDGKEFQIVLSKFSGRRLKMRLMSGDSKGLVIYPEKTDLKSTENWLELVVPKTKPTEDKEAEKQKEESSSASASRPPGMRSAAKTFLETREKSGLEAALLWLDGLDAEKAQQYRCEEKEFLNIGKEMKSFGEVEEAARFFESATKLIPQSYAIWENLGATYVRVLRKEEAVRCFQQAIAVDPKNRGAQQQLKMIDILLEDTRHETRDKMRFRPGENTGLRGPYLGQRPPGMKPELFAPGIVSVFGSNENTVTLSPDGRELYFGKESGIWVCRWTEEGWTAPQNTGWPGYEMWISPDSGKMYYTGYEPGIWVMEKSGTGWGKPQKIVSNGMFSTLTRDETLYTTVFSERGKANVGRYVKKDGKYETPEVLGPEVNSPNGFDAHPNVALDGSFILFDRQDPGGNGLYISFKGPDGAWSPARSLGSEFNGSVSTFSPDGKYLFFMKNRDIYWVSAKITEELRPKE